MRSYGRNGYNNGNGKMLQNTNDTSNRKQNTEHRERERARVKDNELNRIDN